MYFENCYELDNFKKFM